MDTYKIVSSNGSIISYVRSNVPPAKYEIVEATCTIPSFDHNDPDFDLIDEVEVNYCVKYHVKGEEVPSPFGDI